VARTAGSGENRLEKHGSCASALKKEESLTGKRTLQENPTVWGRWKLVPIKNLREECSTAEKAMRGAKWGQKKKTPTNKGKGRKKRKASIATTRRKKGKLVISVKEREQFTEREHHIKRNGHTQPQKKKTD